MRTFGINDDIYSVDMMIAYIKIYKPKITHTKIDNYIASIINYKGWGSPTGKRYSPQDVLNNPKKYKDDYKRIINANLNYPIIITDGNVVVDGIHRLIKAHLTGSPVIKTYYFNKTLMNKFRLDSSNNWKKVDAIETYDLIILFNKKFKPKD